MSTLIDTLESSGGAASVIWNEYEIRVTTTDWFDDDGGYHSGWAIHAEDFLADSRPHRTADGPDAGAAHRYVPMVNDYRVETWEELSGVMGELGIPDAYGGWR